MLNKVQFGFIIVFFTLSFIYISLVDVTFVWRLVRRDDLVEDEDPGVHVNVHADPTVGDEDLPINMFCESELREL